MKFTEGGFRDWGYDVARREYGALPIGDGPWLKLPNGIVIKDCIADAFLQEILLHPENFDVVATLNLNGGLHLRRPGGAGRRHRNRPRRQHQLPDGAFHF